VKRFDYASHLDSMLDGSGFEKVMGDTAKYQEILDKNDQPFIPCGEETLSKPMPLASFVEHVETHVRSIWDDVGQEIVSPVYYILHRKRKKVTTMLTGVGPPLAEDPEHNKLKFAAIVRKMCKMNKAVAVAMVSESRINFKAMEAMGHKSEGADEDGVPKWWQSGDWCVMLNVDSHYPEAKAARFIRIDEQGDQRILTTDISEPFGDMQWGEGKSPLPKKNWAKFASN